MRSEKTSAAVERWLPATASDVLAVEDVRIMLGGITAARVRQLDPELKPQRTPAGVRFYRREIVERVVAARRAAQVQK